MSRQDAAPPAAAEHQPRVAAAGGDYTAAALELVRCLNRIEDSDGRRLSARVRLEGFEPWWFHQEDLMWRILVPYLRHRALAHELLAGGELPPGGLPEELHKAWRLLARELPSTATRAAAGAGRSRLVRLRAAVSRSGLLLVTVLAAGAFRLLGRDTLLFILDSVSPGLRHDFRFDPVYRELRHRGYRFSEFLHLSGYRDGFSRAWRNLWRRRRPAIFLELPARLLAAKPPAAPPPRFTIDAARVPDSRDREFLAAVARWHLRRSAVVAAETRAYAALLRRLKVRRAVLPDDVRHVTPLVVACKLAGIPSLGFMHGLLNRYHPTLMAYGFADARRHTFDLYGVWNGYFRQRLLAGSLLDAGSVVATGPLRAPTGEQLAAARASRRRSPQPVRVLLASEPRPSRRQVARYLERLLADAAVQLLVKLRPGEPRPRFAELPAAAARRIEIVRTATTYESFARCDVVIGTYSSVLYEAALVMRPAVVLHTDFSYGYDIVEDGLAGFAESPEVVVERVLEAARLDEEELDRRRREIWGDRLTDGASELFDAAEARLWAPPR